MSYIIYRQSYAWQCGSYACLNALQRMWVNITEHEMLALGFMGWYNDIRRTLTKAGYITWLSSRLISPRRIDNYLAKGHKMVVKMIRNNFESIRHPPHIQDFKWIMWHFVCLDADLWDKWRYIDQQWEKFGDKWHWYILKKDIKMIDVRYLYLNYEYLQTL